VGARTAFVADLARCGVSGIVTSPEIMFIAAPSARMLSERILKQRNQ